LSDLFSSFAILFDKPFVPGDFIVVGNHKGTVLKIGIKTTRLRSPQGEEIIISNQELTSARIQNFKKMKERRVTFLLGVIYETPSDKFEKIPSMLKKIISSNAGARFDRAHFNSFGESALEFEVAYYILSAEYIDFLNLNQKIYYAIKRKFEEESIDMAYPTRTIYMQKS
jgi:MscS family membrane protein